MARRPTVTRMGNAWSALANRPREALAYTVRSVDDAHPPCVALILRDRRGPHSMLCAPRQDVKPLAEAIRASARREDHGAFDFAQIHDRDLTLSERIRTSWSILRGTPRWADAWVVNYIRLTSGTELIMVELGSRRERRAHSRLPLPLDAAAALADELDAAAGDSS